MLKEAWIWGRTRTQSTPVAFVPLEHRAGTSIHTGRAGLWKAVFHPVSPLSTVLSQYCVIGSRYGYEVIKYRALGL